VQDNKSLGLLWEDMNKPRRHSISASTAEQISQEVEVANRKRATATSDDAEVNGSAEKRRTVEKNYLCLPAGMK